MARIVVDMKRSNDPMQEYADLEVEWLWAAFKQGWDDLKHQQHLERFRDGGQ